MRRVGFAVTVTLGLVLIAAPASADPTPTPGAARLAIPVPAATPGATVCSVGGNVAVGMSGLVATGSGYVVIDGKNPDWSQLRIVYLDKNCARTSSPQSYSGSGAVDPQDLAIDSKGALWVADIGDSDNPVSPVREVISLWKVPSRNGTMTHYKFTYTDGPHNAQAMLMDAKGAPIFVTKNISGPAGIYTFTGALTTGQTMKLTKVGTFQPEQTGTVNKLGTHGQAQNAITGGAVAPGVARVALRTLSDAYEWDVSGGNVVGALTKGTPRITPLPSEDQGYAIAYTTDGKSFLTVSSSGVETPMLRYTPAKAVPKPSTGGGAVGTVKKPKPPSALRKWFDKLTLSQLMWYLGGLAALGLVLVLLGIFGIRRSRRKTPPTPARGAAGPGANAGAPVAGRAALAAPPPGAYGPPRTNAAPNFYPEYGDDGQVIAPAYDPYGADQPAAGRYGADPYADPFGAPGSGGGHGPGPAGPPPAGPVYGAPRNGAAYGGQPPYGSQPPAPDNGGYQGGSYGAASDPYQQDPVYPGDDGRRPSPHGRPGYEPGSW